MSGFLDVLLRGLLLVAVAVAAGGVAWLRLVLRVEPGAKVGGAAAASLRLVALAAAVAAAAQAAVALVVLAELLTADGAGALAAFLDTAFARIGGARVALAAALAALAVRLGRRPGGRAAWLVLGGLAAALVASSSGLSHAMARLEQRALLAGLDTVHQLGIAVWVGGLAHFTLFAGRARAGVEPDAPGVARRFSAVALASMAAIVASGAALTVLYVGEPAALIGTAYGIMVVSKVLLLLLVLGLAALNFQAVRRAASAADLRLGRFVEVELGLGITILFAAASLTSLPPAVDVTADRATIAEVASRFAPALPRLTSPAHDELMQNPSAAESPTGERHELDRQWSEYNHHMSGAFVLLMGLLALAEGAGVRAARHWPLVLLGLAAFMFLRNDPRAWPLGPMGFWESMLEPDTLQHRVFTLLVVVFAVFEWMVRTGRLSPRPWARVFPLLCAVGGGLLLTHSHAMFNLKDEFLVEVTHAPLGLLGACLGWARWLEVRLPGVGTAPGWTWRACLVAVGVLLLMYREG